MYKYCHAFRARLILFTNNKNYLPFVESFTVNDKYLLLITSFSFQYQQIYIQLTIKNK